MATIGLSAADLRTGGSLEQAVVMLARKLGGVVSGTWMYTDAAGDPVLAVVRLETSRGKAYRPLCHEEGNWRIGDPAGPLPLYRLLHLKDRNPVFICEGEKSADAGWTIGIACTTSAHGAKAAKKTNWAPLAGKQIIVLPDNDDAGRRYAADVVRLVKAAGAASACVIGLPGLPESGDIVDFIAARPGKSGAEIRTEIEALVQAAPPYQPPSSTRTSSSTSAPPGRPVTDYGNAERLVRAHGADLHYAARNWVVWDGRRWTQDQTGEVMRRAKATVRAIYTEAAKGSDTDARKQLAKHAMRSEAEARLRAMVKLAESEPNIPLLMDQFDRDPWLLNVGNGTLDLRTGTLVPHQREHLITKIIDVDYDSQAGCPLWEAFLDRVLDGNASLKEFLRRAAGYSLTGSTREQVLFFLYGRGANGKSVFARTWLGLLGPYATQAEPNLLVVRRGERHPTGVADLQGRRLVVSSEVENGERLAEVAVKQLTGEDRVKARFMRQDFFEYTATYKLWLIANHKPQVRGTDFAIWRRITLVPFTVTIPDAEQDRNLAEKLAAEFPGILAWAVRGCLAWQQQGLQPPAEVVAATAEYKSEMDALADFLEDECVLGVGNRCRVRDLHAAYVVWCQRRHQVELGKNDLRDALIDRDLPVPTKSTGGVYFWIGIGLRGRPPVDRVEWGGPEIGLPRTSAPHEGGNGNPVQSAPLSRPRPAPPPSCAPEANPPCPSGGVPNAQNQEDW